MKIPKTIRMFGSDWKVIIDPKKEGGSYSWEKREIFLGDKCHEKESILIHELLEAVMTHLHYRFYGQEGSMEYEFHFNHTGFVNIHQMFFTILKDNKLI